LSRAGDAFPVSFPGRQGVQADQDSSDSFVSSIIMSLNSLDSKTSPHSLHSTNSASSSRATICTRGCWHGAGLRFCSGDWDGGDGVINPGLGGPVERPGDFAGNWRYFRTACPVVKSFVGLCARDDSVGFRPHGLGVARDQRSTARQVALPQAVKPCLLPFRCRFSAIACNRLHWSGLASNIGISD
jgi:hypothetical protein